MMNADRRMFELLEVARGHAEAPISGFRVGAVVQGGSGTLYTGANLEIANRGPGLTMHAEQAALANAYMAGESRIEAIAVTAAPCGLCRQFLLEMSPDASVRVLTERNEVLLRDLLPFPFGPLDLERTGGALPRPQHALTLVEPTGDETALAALEAARASYAPYTDSPSGVGVLTSLGRVFSGSYIENVAFNPSLSPLHAAFASLYAAQGHLHGLVRVVLAEVEGAKISQKYLVRAALPENLPVMRVLLKR